MWIRHQVGQCPIEELLEVIVCHNTNCKIAHIHLTLLFLGRQTASKTLWEELLNGRYSTTALCDEPCKSHPEKKRLCKGQTAGRQLVMLSSIQ